MSEDVQVVGLDEMPIILKIPKNTAQLKITATMLNDDGEPTQVTRKLSTSEVYACHQDFLDNVELGDDYDAVYTLTDEGRALAEALFGADE